MVDVRRLKVNVQMCSIRLSGLLQIGMVEHCNFSAHSQIYHTERMLLTHADDLLCLQLNTVEFSYTVHTSNPC